MNYYKTTIKSDKMNVNIAYEILMYIKDKYKIRYFDFSENGTLEYCTRDLPNISNILETNNFQLEEIEIKDEFELVKEI